VAEIPLL